MVISQDCLGDGGGDDSVGGHGHDDAQDVGGSGGNDNYSIGDSSDNRDDNGDGDGSVGDGDDVYHDADGNAMPVMQRMVIARVMEL